MDGCFELEDSNLSQVLDHVPQPAHYVAECFRVLNPRGLLVLTTHGSWMSLGLPKIGRGRPALVFEKRRLPNKEVKKLTFGPRAVCCFINQGIRHLRAPNGSLFGFAMWGSRGLWRFNPCWLNRCAEKF